MKKIIVFILAFITITIVSQAQPVLSAGAATNVTAVGFEVKWQGFRNSGSGTGLYVGTNINSASRSSSTTGNNTYNKPGNNTVTFSYNKTTDILSATVRNKTASFSNVTGKMSGTSVCRLNFMQIVIGDSKNKDVDLENIEIAGANLGSVSYTGGSDKYWNIANVDFTSNFTFSAKLVLQNSIYGSGDESFVHISVGERTAFKTMSLTPACEGSPAEIKLTGLLPNKSYTANYTMGLLGASITSPSFTSNAIGEGIFITRNISITDLAQIIFLKSLNAGCDINVPALSSTAIIVIRNYWVGAISNDWSNPLNWAGGVMPESVCDKVIVPGGTIFQPSLSGTTFQLENLEIKSGVTVNVANGTLKVSGDIINQGTLDLSQGTLELNGKSGAQTIAGSLFKNKTVMNLVNNNSTGINILAVSGDTLKIGGSISFGNVNGSVINTGDNVSLLSNATRTATVGDMTNDGLNSGNQVLGKVISERFISNAAKWRFVSINTNTTQTFKQAWQENAAAANGNPNPGYGLVIGDNRSASYVANGFDAYTPGGPTVKVYNSATNAWVGITNTNQPINTTGGYMAYVRSNRSGSLSSTVIRTSGALKSGTQPIISVPANKFVAVGNPFASPINVTKLNATGLQEVFYVWDPKLGGAYGLGAYQSLIKMGANYVIFPGGGSFGAQLTPTSMIESGQAFFVKGGSSAGSLQIEERSKGAGTNMVFRGAMENSPTIRASLLVPTADTALMVDATMINFDSDYASGIDDDDIQKVGNNNENVCIINNNNYLMAERKPMKAAADTIQLFMSGVRAQNYRWQLNLDHMEATGRIVTLVDRYTNVQTVLDMDETTTYNFSIVNVPASYAANRFYIVMGDMAVLPVTITSVSASRTDANTALVTWKVTGETNMDHYEVETSINGIVFNKIADVPPLSGNNGVADYNMTHTEAVAGINFYRIKAISVGGREQYSAIVKIAALATLETSLVKVFPNPVEDKIMKVSFDGKSGSYELALISMSGTQVFSKTISVAGGSSRFALPLGSQIAAGQYSLVITGSDGTSNIQSLIIL